MPCSKPLFPPGFLTFENELGDSVDDSSSDASHWDFSLDDEEDGDEEDEESGNGEAESAHLPEHVVITVPVVEVIVEGEEDEEVEGEGHEVLNREAPPILEDWLPPVNLGIADVLAELGHRSGKLANTIEHDVGYPLLAGQLADNEGDDPDDDEPAPESDHADPAFR